ncbi:MAG: ACT domain-containing protein [Clostridiaceae bacterium]|jgi:ACT domain-containing protein|nr:ACT domain-containing protein [Clostridiaceae bacterium]
MRAVITVIGCDKVGLIAEISAILAKANVNILDISQTTMQDLFTMMMLTDLDKMNMDFAMLKEQLTLKGQELGVDVRIQREEIFQSMHRI